MKMFVKLFNQILDSSIADDRRLRHFFTDLLLCADSKGFVMMTDAAIARRIGAEINEVQWGLKELQKPDPKSKTTTDRGKRIEPLKGAGYGYRIINFETYRAMRDADQMREATRERVRRHRARKSSQNQGNAESNAPGNADVTESNGGNAIKKESKSKKESNTERERDGAPSLKEAVAAGLETGIPDYVTTIWWEARESNGWMKATQGGGLTPVVNWRADLSRSRTWAEEEHSKSKKSHSQKTNGYNERTDF